MLYRISVAERGLTGTANIFRSRLSKLDDLLRAGTVPLSHKTIPLIYLLVNRVVRPVIWCTASVLVRTSTIYDPRRTLGPG